jgi:hypothetical protein
MKKMLLIDSEAAQQILNYLATRPYQESFKLVPLLLNLKTSTEGQEMGQDTAASTDEMENSPASTSEEVTQ